jgi:REase_DpnII-MboI
MKFSWTQDAALLELDQLMAELVDLSTQRRFSAPHTRWVARTLAILEEVFGQESRYYQSIAGLSWTHSGHYVLVGSDALNPERALDRRGQEAYLRHLDSAKGILQAAADHLMRVGLEAIYQGKNSPPEASLILKVLGICEQKLRKAVRDIPKAEKEVQDALENLLLGADIPYSRETESIEYSSKTYTPDFTISRADLALEAKLCARAGREKEIIAEINDDILAYRTKFGNSIFVVYDCGFIRDVDRFAQQFEAQTGVLVRVVKH